MKQQTKKYLFSTIGTKKGMKTMRPSERFIRKIVIILGFVTLFFGLQQGILWMLNMPSLPSILLALSGAIYALVASRIFDSVERKHRYQVTVKILEKRCEYLKYRVAKLGRKEQNHWIKQK